MLRSIQQLYGNKLRATDGDFGHVRDFYFDDQEWAVRYVVAETGTWLPGRMVLLSPHAFGPLCEEDDCLLVNLTRNQIEDSPARESHQPVSRQFEEEYYGYYQWPPYWNGGGLWGIGQYPMDPIPYAGATAEEIERRKLSRDNDPNLRSTLEIKNYQIDAGGEAIGEVIDFILNDESWAIPHLVVKTGHWYASKEIILSPRHVERVSYHESKIIVSVTREAIAQAPEYRGPAAGAELPHAREAGL